MPEPIVEVQLLPQENTLHLSWGMNVEEGKWLWPHKTLELRLYCEPFPLFGQVQIQHMAMRSRTDNTTVSGGLPFFSNIGVSHGKEISEDAFRPTGVIADPEGKCYTLLFDLVKIDVPAGAVVMYPSVEWSVNTPNWLNETRTFWMHFGHTENGVFHKIHSTEPFSVQGKSLHLREKYLQYLIEESEAELTDKLYINLSGRAEQTKDTRTQSFGLRMNIDVEFDLTKLQAEVITGNDFSQQGKDVTDVRETIGEYRRVVLLGDPGAGKTTTILKLVVDYARVAQTNFQAILPVVVPLRTFRGEQSFQDFVSENLGVFRDVPNDFQVIYLMDALNEMPRKGTDGRNLITEVRDFLRDKSDWVVSCRVRDYQDELRNLSKLGKVRIRPLNLQQIHDFIMRFFKNNTEADVEQGKHLWILMKGNEILLEIWKRLRDKDLEQTFWGHTYPEKIVSNSYRNFWFEMYNDPRKLMYLARNPYMLWMICKLFESTKHLPKNRGELFKQFVEKLLEREEVNALHINTVWIDSALIKQGLARVAFTMSGLTEITQLLAKQLLNYHLPNTNADLLLQLAASASLIDIGNEIHFTHHLLQEYFASEVLGSQIDDGVAAEKIWPQSTWWQPTQREETAIILAGVRDDTENIVLWLANAQPELAAQVINQSGGTPPSDMTLLKLQEKWIPRLTDLENDSHPHARASIGRALGQLKLATGEYLDNRKGVSTFFRDNLKLPDIDWIMIPDEGMSFFQLFGNLQLSDYGISRYPITNAQFSTFVSDDKGFSDLKWFEGLPEDDLARNISLIPMPSIYTNHPRIAVNWCHAMAFCRWLSWRLGGPYSIDNLSEWLIRLPTELEWEKAAIVWKTFDPLDANGFNTLKGNISSIGIRQPNAVGIFPDAQSVYGLEDLRGNVWEWCLSGLYHPDTEVNSIDLQTSEWRIQKGGSWKDSEHDLYRRGRSPFESSYDIGFRVVCHPDLIKS
jgi:hypothetical protein